MIRSGANYLRLLKQQSAFAAAGLQRFSHTQAKPFVQADKCQHFSEAEGYYRSSPFEPITIPNLKIHDYMWQNLPKYQKLTAAECVVTGRKYTYAELRDASAALAYRFRKFLNLNPRDVIAIVLPNLPEYPIICFGAFEAGLTVTSVNPIYKSEEISRQLEMSNAKFVVCLNENFQVVQDACKLSKRQIGIATIRNNPNDILAQGAVDLLQLINPEGIDFTQIPSTSEITADDLAFLPFSSGTTGLPKGVVLKHKNITANCEQIQSKLPYELIVPATTDEYQYVAPAILPFFHIYGFTIVLLSKLFLGCKLVTMPKFTPEDFIKSLVKHKGSALHLVPPVLLFMTHCPHLTKENTPDLRLAMSGAAPVGQLDVDKFLNKFPHVSFAQGYGLTETSPVILVTPNNNKRYSSAGFLMGSTEMKITPLEGTDKGLGPNQTGELCCRGPQVMDGYLNNPEATEATFYPNGWFRTGDVGHYDEDGYFYITDRMKELIKVKGFQVPPAELEEILRDHEKIMDAAVIGIPHPANGEAPKAVVVLKPKCEATEEEIKEFVASKVAHYKKLEGGVAFVDVIPKNASGKILRRELKERFVQ